jgi:CRP-like cAMP-binding protein
MVDSSNEILQELQRQTRWLRFLGLQQLRPILLELLRDPRERRAFELSDGSRSTREVGEIVGVSGATISRWWTKWAAVGIVSQDERGTAQHLVSVEDAGL